MNTTNGNIAKQSKRKLINALFTVMQQYDFKEITITQLTQEAHLSRKTFYRLFSDKEDLLHYYFQQIIQECISEIKARQIHNYWSTVQLYFDFWEEKQELLILLKKHNLLLFLTQDIYEHSYEIFAYVRSQEVMEEFMPTLPYMLAYTIGGVHTMLVKWIEDDMKVPSRQLLQTLKAGLQSPAI